MCVIESSPVGCASIGLCKYMYIPCFDGLADQNRMTVVIIVLELKWLL